MSHSALCFYMLLYIIDDLSVSYKFAGTVHISLGNLIRGRTFNFCIIETDKGTSADSTDLEKDLEVERRATCNFCTTLNVMGNFDFY